MSARRLLPLLLAACLATIALEAGAVNVVIDNAVTRTNNNVILDGNDTITINRGGSITVNESSPNSIGGITSDEQNTGILLRGVGTRVIRGTEITVFNQPSSNNTITNNGDIIVSGNSSEGVSVLSPTDGANNRLINHGLIRASSGDSFNGARAVVFSPNSTIINNGTIESLGNNASYTIIMGGGANTRIINNGLIRTNSRSEIGRAIQIEGAGGGSSGGEINNNATGRILQQGARSAVIRVTSRVTGFTVNNAGEIAASGADADSKGIYFTHNSANSNHTVNNSGAISTQGDGAQAVLFGSETGVNNSTGNRLENSGTITTRGDNASGVQAGNNNTIHNRKGGVISTQGEFSDGMDLRSNNTIINDGTIRTSSRQFARGIDAEDGNQITIGRHGRIQTSGLVGHGIRADKNNTIINYGQITTSGRNAHGIDVTISGSEITNNGEITTSGRSSSAIYAPNILETGRGKITHNGRITTTGSNADGIRAFNTATLTLNGRITTSGPASHGVTAGTGTRLAFGQNSRIKTAAADADGVRIAGLAPDQTTLTHPGHIEAGGTGLRLPWVQRLDNSGTILGLNGAGVTFTGLAPGPVTVHNTGTIAGGAYGLDAGNNTLARLDNTSRRTLRGRRNAALRAARLDTLNNSGLILSEQASAIRLTGTGGPAATIRNRGTIQGHIQGLDYGNQSIATLHNTGLIQGTTGLGVKAAGLARLTNRGTIAGQTALQLTRPSGGASGVAGSGPGATLDNAGILRALAGPSGTALDLQGPGRDTLRLQPGGRIEGRILWDGQDDTLRLETPGPVRLTLTDNDAPAQTEPTRFTVQTPAGRPVFRSTARSSQPGQATTTLTVLDPAQTDPRTDATQSLWTGALFQGLAAQAGLATPAGSANRRSLTPAPYHHLWARPFGGLHTFRRDGRAPAARYRYGGALAGYTRLIEGVRFGAFLGAGRSALTPRGAGQTGASVEGRDIFLGAFALAPWRDLEVSAALLFGESRTETEWSMRDNRATGGLAQVRFEGRHYALSPELGLATRLTFGGLDWRPELRLRYLGLFGAGARAQSDPTALGLQPEDRHIGLIRASLGLPLRFPANSYGGQLSGQLRLGAEGRKRFGGETVAVRQGNQTARYEAAGGEAVRGFVGAGFEYAVPALNLGFGLDIEAGYDSRAALGIQGQLGFVWGF